MACYRNKDLLKSFKHIFTIYKMDKYISSNVKMKIENIGKLDLSHIDRKFEKIEKKCYDLSHIDRKPKALTI